MPHVMYKQLIINMTAQETQVALLEDGTIAEVVHRLGEEFGYHGECV